MVPMAVVWETKRVDSHGRLQPTNDVPCGVRAKETPYMRGRAKLLLKARDTVHGIGGLKG